MATQIRPLQERDIDNLVRLSLSAFEPIFSSFAAILGKQIFPAIYPDWVTSQSDGVRATCTDPKYTVWVADVDSVAVGFIAYELSEEEKTGEVILLAVHPDHQNDLALLKMKEAGMEVAVVGTGGDVSHAPARRSYEKAGYTGLPLVRFYKKL